MTISRCDLFPSAEALLADIREDPYPIPSSERPARQFALDLVGREARQGPVRLNRSRLKPGRTSSDVNPDDQGIWTLKL